MERKIANRISMRSLRSFAANRIFWYRLLSASDYALDTVWFGAPGYKPVK